MGDAAGSKAVAKKQIVKVEPLHAHVLHDLGCCVGRYELGPEFSFALFRSVFFNMKLADVFLTQRCGGRFPTINETDSDYASLLLRAASRHMLLRESSFEHHLGGLFLTFTLWSLQHSTPRASVTLSEDDWGRLEELREELRRRQHAEGFRALHTLWERKALLYTKAHSVFTEDIANEAKALERSERLQMQMRPSEVTGALLPLHPYLDPPVLRMYMCCAESRCNCRAAINAAPGPLVLRLSSCGCAT
jgi:hypothetical protein